MEMKGWRRDGGRELTPAHPAAKTVCSKGCCQPLPLPAPAPHLPVSPRSLLSPASPSTLPGSFSLLALPVHAVDGLQVGQGFADLQRVEDEGGHGQAVLVLLQVLPQLQRDERGGLRDRAGPGRVAGGRGGTPLTSP